MKITLLLFTFLISIQTNLAQNSRLTPCEVKSNKETFKGLIKDYNQLNISNGLTVLFDGEPKQITMTDFKETPQQKDIADYNVYLQLKDLNYSNSDIAKHLSYTNEELSYLISRYTFKGNLEYKLQEQEGNYHFNGKFYVTQNVNTCLTPDEILEIYTFTQDLVKQHKGIDYLQSFYSVEQDCKLFFIDNLSKAMLESGNYKEQDNYCTLMLASDY